MSLRETLNRRSSMTSGVAAFGIVLALAATVWQVWPRAARQERILTQYYFTTDSGRGFFADQITRVPPFVQDGQEASQAMVYKCGWGKPFVGYLLRYSPEMKKRMDEANARGQPMDPLASQRGAEVKRPEDSEWVSLSDARSSEVRRVLCSNGTMDGLEAVWP